MGWTLNARDFHQQHEVGGVTGRHENTLSQRSLVNWALVALEYLELCCLARSKQHHWTFGEENFRVTFIQR